MDMTVPNTLLTAAKS